MRDLRVLVADVIRHAREAAAALAAAADDPAATHVTGVMPNDPFAAARRASTTREETDNG